MTELCQSSVCTGSKRILLNSRPFAGVIATVIAVLYLLVAMAGVFPANAASKIKVVVNGEAITTYDIARRAALFKLRRIKGNRTELAMEELIEEAIKMQTAKRFNMIVNEQGVTAAYARFAKNNKMPVNRLTQMLDGAGVTQRGFKKYIRAQMSWQRLMAAKLQAEGNQTSTQDIFAQLHSQGAEKPSTTEYTLQQVIFVVPAAKRSSLMTRRRREARAFKNRFENCANTIEFAKKLKDVTVRSLGRVLQPQLPPDWKDLIIATPEGKTTKIRDTQRGVEFLAVCRSKTISDDLVAEVSFQINQSKSTGGKVSESEKKYIQELRDLASISRR